MNQEHGVLIEINDAQKEVRKNAETAIGWEYREEAKFLYDLAILFRDRLVDPILRLDRNQVPDPVISFENARNVNVLASYTLNRNPQGLLYEISFNTSHYETVDGKKTWKYGRWAQAESLLHECLHLKQQKYGRDPYRGRGGGHNKEFVTMAKSLGLNVVPVIGCHYQVADNDSPFGILMKELGINRPNDVPRIEGIKIKDDWFEIGKKRKGKSSLTKYSCGCGQNAWIGSAEFNALCLECGNEFVKATALREMANTVPEPPKSTILYDPDDLMHRQQEDQEFKDTDEWEDLSTYMEAQ